MLSCSTSSTTSSSISSSFFTNILSEYEPTKQIGEGSYGFVFDAIEKKTQRKVALKK